MSELSEGELDEKVATPPPRKKHKTSKQAHKKPEKKKRVSYKEELNKAKQEIQRITEEKEKLENSYNLLRKDYKALEKELSRYEEKHRRHNSRDGKDEKFRLKNDDVIKTRYDDVMTSSLALTWKGSSSETSRKSSQNRESFPPGKEDDRRMRRKRFDEPSTSRKHDSHHPSNRPPRGGRHTTSYRGRSYNRGKAPSPPRRISSRGRSRGDSSSRSRERSQETSSCSSRLQKLSTTVAASTSNHRRSTDKTRHHRVGEKKVEFVKDGGWKDCKEVALHSSPELTEINFEKTKIPLKRKADSSTDLTSTAQNKTAKKSKKEIEIPEEARIAENILANWMKPHKSQYSSIVEPSFDDPGRKINNRNPLNLGVEQPPRNPLNLGGEQLPKNPLNLGGEQLPRNPLNVGVKQLPIEITSVATTSPPEDYSQIGRRLSERISNQNDPVLDVRKSGMGKTNPLNLGGATPSHPISPMKTVVQRRKINNEPSLNTSCSKQLTYPITSCNQQPRSQLGDQQPACPSFDYRLLGVEHIGEDPRKDPDKPYNPKNVLEFKHCLYQHDVMLSASQERSTPVYSVEKITATPEEPENNTPRQFIFPQPLPPQQSNVVEEHTGQSGGILMSTSVEEPSKIPHVNVVPHNHQSNVGTRQNEDNVGTRQDQDNVGTRQDQDNIGLNQHHNETDHNNVEMMVTPQIPPAARPTSALNSVLMYYRNPALQSLIQLASKTLRKMEANGEVEPETPKRKLETIEESPRSLWVSTSEDGDDGRIQNNVENEDDSRIQNNVENVDDIHVDICDDARDGKEQVITIPDVPPPSSLEQLISTNSGDIMNISLTSSMNSWLINEESLRKFLSTTGHPILSPIKQPPKYKETSGSKSSGKLLRGKKLFPNPKP